MCKILMTISRFLRKVVSPDLISLLPPVKGLMQKAPNLGSSARYASEVVVLGNRCFPYGLTSTIVDSLNLTGEIPIGLSGGAFLQAR